jgi:hypothetical protein
MRGSLPHSWFLFWGGSEFHHQAQADCHLGQRYHCFAQRLAWTYPHSACIHRLAELNHPQKRRMSRPGRSEREPLRLKELNYCELEY